MAARSRPWSRILRCLEPEPTSRSNPVVFNLCSLGSAFESLTLHGTTRLTTCISLPRAAFLKSVPTPTRASLSARRTPQKMEMKLVGLVGVRRRRQGNASLYYCKARRLRDLRFLTCFAEEMQQNPSSH